MDISNNYTRRDVFSPGWVKYQAGTSALWLWVLDDENGKKFDQRLPAPSEDCQPGAVQ